MKPSSLWALAATIIAAAGVLWLYDGYRVEATAQRDIMISRGETALESLSAALRAHGRMGQPYENRLSVIFEEFVTAPGMLAARLTTPDGQSLATAGDASLLPPLGPTSFSEWRGHCLIITREIPPPGPGFGPRPALRPDGPPDLPPDQPPDPNLAPPHGPGRGMGPGWRGGRGPGAFPDAPPWMQAPYWLTIVVDTAQMQSALTHARMRFLASTALLVTTVFLGGWMLSNRERRRLLETELETAHARAAQHEQMAHLGAGLAHETKNPLGLVRGLAQSIAASPGIDDTTRQRAQTIVDEADRTVGRINGFLTLARPKQPELTEVHLDILFKRLLELVQADAREKGIAVRAGQAPIRVRADEDLLRRALLNLLLNAIQASSKGGQVLVEAVAQAGTVVIRVQDQGQGISSQDLPHVTEPYFTRSAGGTGLGLTLVDQIAHSHGWRLHIASVQGQGSEVRISGLIQVQ